MNVEIAKLSTPHTFLVGYISLDCVVGSNFLAKTAAQFGFKAKELPLYQGNKSGTAPVQEEICNQEEEDDIKNIIGNKDI